MADEKVENRTAAVLGVNVNSSLLDSVKVEEVTEPVDPTST